MKVLVVGSGGREHALCWKLGQSPKVSQVFCAPGNAGIEKHATCVNIGVNDSVGLVKFVRDQGISFTVIGPEDPLSKGIVDIFHAEGLKVYGPSGAAAQIEASKAFAKDIMREAGIPTAAYGEFDNAEAAIAYVREHGAPIVVKADGLAAGKGVTVAQTVDEAIAAINEAMVGHAFGSAGNRGVIEECLFGEEASILAFSDGTHIVPMMASQDHKAAFDGDKGPNTGGMGAYSPAPVVTPAMLAEIEKTVLQPCIATMAKRGMPFVGTLYAGLMITKDGPKVIEYNCRFGDPETQVVLPQLKTDLLDVLIACSDGTLAQQAIEWHTGACVSVVMASKGYPGDYPKGIPIHGLDVADNGKDVIVFHAGTKRAGDAIVTNGGRVLNVTAFGDDIPGAIAKAYIAVKKITFDGAQYRTDIGKKALARA